MALPLRHPSTASALDEPGNAICLQIYPFNYLQAGEETYGLMDPAPLSLTPNNLGMKLSRQDRISQVVSSNNTRLWEMPDAPDRA